MNKGSNAMYVKGVKNSSIYTIRAVMLCMPSKEVQNGHNCLNIQLIFNLIKVLESCDLLCT